MEQTLGDDGLIDHLSSEIAACRICRDCPAGGEAKRLPHEPRPVAVLSKTAKILIAGQAPGLRVHGSGLPFNDASGDRLRAWMDVDRATFYNPALFAVVPMGFCFPGYNAQGHDLPPRRECAPQWRRRVLEVMPQIEMVLAIGLYAQKYHLGTRAAGTVTETVSRWREYHGANSGPVVFPLPHPSWRNSAWLKRNPWFASDLLPILQKDVKIRIS